MSRMNVQPSEVKSKDKIPYARMKVSKRRPKDHPKRPLSAYNYFFKDQRAAIVLALYENDKKVAEEKKAKAGADKETEGRLKKADSDDSENTPTNAIEKPEYVSEYKVDLDQETMARLKKNDGSVSFEQIGKLIGKHWKCVDPARLAKYEEKAKVDRARYKKEMIEYDKRHEDRLRLEMEMTGSVGSKVSEGEDPSVAGTLRATYQDFRVPTSTSAFSSIATPSSSYSYGSSYGMSQQGMHPAYYGQYGTGTRHQGTNVASMSTGNYGYGATSTSNMPGLGSGGGYGYSRSYNPIPAVSSRGSYEGIHRGYPYPIQSMAGSSFEGNHPEAAYASHHPLLAHSSRSAFGEGYQHHPGHMPSNQEPADAPDHSGHVFSNVPFDGEHQPFPSHPGRMSWDGRHGG